MSIKSKAVFIIHPHGNLLANVTLNYLVKSLLAENVKLILFTSCKDSRVYFKDNPRAIFRKLPLLYPHSPRRPWLFLKKTLFPLLVSWLDSLVNPGHKIICIDPEGFYSASKMFPHLVKKFNYISFELFFLDELKSSRSIQQQQREIGLVAKGIEALVIPDHYRHRLFTEEHKNSNIKHTFYLPVSPAPQVVPVSDAAYKPRLRYGQRAVIYSGSLYEWAGIGELIKVMKDQWNKKFHLHIHVRAMSENRCDELRHFIKQHAPGFDVTVLNFAFSDSEYLLFVKQFEIGLATYLSFTSDSPYDGKNFDEIGYSSSKFNTLMMLGIPTIATNNNSFRDIRKEYDFGYVINDFTELREALQYIDINYEKNRSEARRVYDDLMDPTKKMAALVQHLKTG